MNIALVRGPFTNAWEAQNFLPLADRHRITVFSTYGAMFSSREVPLRQVRLFAPETPLAVCSRNAATVFNKVLNRLVGADLHLFGLGSRLRGMDVVHTMELYHTFTGQVLAAARRYGFPVVVTVWENIPFTYERHPVRRAVKERTRREAALFIAPSGSTRDMLLMEGVPPERIVVQPMGIDVSRFGGAPRDETFARSLGALEADATVLFVGRLVWEKGVYELVHAARLVADAAAARGRRVRVLLAGAGPERPALQREIVRLGLERVVVFCGMISYRDMPRLFALADVFALPSIPLRWWREQFGYVLVEALAAGVPVVSTATGAIPEVVGGAGMIVPPADHRALADALWGLLDDPHRRELLARAARSRAEEVYDVRKVAHALERLYERALAR